MWRSMEIVFLGRASVKLQYRSGTVGAMENVLLDRNPGPLGGISSYAKLFEKPRDQTKLRTSLITLL